ncbi:hypothetical protein [Streptomyces adelaidensis]|uniref:hypothetical protein n=1 Tax=Streptomyces adelaidensis TaxID=2796465 RepID=UPI001903B1E5|nr:hypothetical protein [Streptomyces adelaidensis]
MHHTRTAVALAATCLLALTACSSNNDGNGTSAAAAGTSGSGNAEKKPPSLDAQQVVKALADPVPNAKATTVYTADTDPNDLLGRPGGYASKADFTDDRAKPKLKDDAVQQGGSVEVFEDPSAAQDRAKFIGDTLKAAKIFGTEYHYVNSGILLRVSGALTPGQAAEYEAALNKLG